MDGQNAAMAWGLQSPILRGIPGEDSPAVRDAACDILVPSGFMEIAFVLLLLVGAVILFAREILPVDIVTLLVLLALLGTRILTPAEAFGGFGSDIIIILASVFVISGALKESGVVDWLGKVVAGAIGGGERTLLSSVMASVAGLSAFMNNTPSPQ